MKKRVIVLLSAVLTVVVLLGTLQVTQAEKDKYDIAEYQKSYDDNELADDVSELNITVLQRNNMRVIHENAKGYKFAIYDGGVSSVDDSEPHEEFGR